MENVDPKTLLGHLSSAVGHHVINAFSTIVSQAEIIRSLPGLVENPSGEVTDRLETIIRTSLEAAVMTRRLIELSHDLTTFRPQEKGNEVEQVRLDRLASELVSAEQHELGPAANWVLDLAPVSAIPGHSGQLRTMLRLFLQNAVEALPGGKGTITITTRTDPRNWLVLEIRDDGSGMPAEVMEHAVEPFFTTKPESRGIGLTIARGIWRRHRGTLTIESQPGEGTSIRLSAGPALAS